MSDGVDLSDASATLDPDPDVHIGETVLAQKQEGFLKLVLEGLGLNLKIEIIILFKTFVKFLTYFE